MDGENLVYRELVDSEKSKTGYALAKNNDSNEPT
jgi:hypothetical protein